MYLQKAVPTKEAPIIFSLLPIHLIRLHLGVEIYVALTVDHAAANFSIRRFPIISRLSITVMPTRCLCASPLSSIATLRRP